MKKSPLLSRPGNVRGQAVIEYTLIMLVTVAILMALSQVLFKPFGEFISNYMGKYTACLLEYGELPTLGTTAGSQVEDDSECNKRFEGGTITAGRPPRSDGQGSSSSGSRTKTNNNRGSTASEKSSYAGSSSRGGSSNININRRPSSGVESSSRKSGKVVEIALENGGAGGFFGNKNGNSYAISQRKTSSIAITGLTEAEKKELEKKAEGTAGMTVASESVRREKKKIGIKPPPKPIIQEEDKPFTIGNFIRYLFIAALVIALVIFIGGQALQMSKSGEK
ncbi:hypothetical protein [Bdellovibrio bacteriovorus]|uniref:hypothetical protein n=1 Tax=Bdellovibrio bacteriovorus TaxID=959 RepID=UPI0020A3D2BF|nr:hypothetical protein [Bdellovibrio bacteriovorus]